MRRLVAWLGWLALVLAGPALASPVELRSDVALHDGHVTLGDIFTDAGAAGRLVVANASGQAVVLDAGRVQAIARANGLDWDNARGITRIIARADVAPAVQAARGERARAVLAYGRDISTGEIIQPEDLVWSHDLVGAPSDAPRDSSAIIGQAARRPLRAGAAVSAHDVSAPIVIKKDDIVAVAYETEGIRLVLQGKALSSAAVGDVFDVLNPGSKKQIQVVATGPGAAAVGPSVDRFRAAARNSPQFVASLR